MLLKNSKPYRLNPFEILPSDRYFIVGQTGTGKSEYSKRLISQVRSRLLIIDPKHLFKPLQAHKVTDNLERIPSISRRNVVVYRPPVDVLDDMRELDRVFKWVYLWGDCTLYIDELALVVKNSVTYPAYLKALYMQGREKRIAVISSTQRPANVPRFCVSESTVFAKFFLNLRDDQERMSEQMGSAVLEPKAFPKEKLHSGKHTFFYFRNGMNAPLEYEYSL